MGVVPIFTDKVIDGLDVKEDAILGTVELGQFMLILEAVTTYGTKLTTEDVVLLLQYKQDSFNYAVRFINDNLGHMGKEKIYTASSIKEAIEKFEAIVGIDEASEIEWLQFKLLHDIQNEVNVIDNILSYVKASNLENTNENGVKL